MKSLRFISLSVFSIVSAVLGANFVFEAHAQQSNPNKHETGLIVGGVNGEPDALPPRRHKTAKEKEYSELAQKIREADQEFEKAWRSAKPKDRQKLRNERMEKLQPTLARMNQLAAEIRNERTTLKGGPAPVPVPLTGSVILSEEIKGKSRQELLQMGVAPSAIPSAERPTSSNDEKAKSR